MHAKIHLSFSPELFALAGLGNGSLCLAGRKSRSVASLSPAHQRRTLWRKHRFLEKLCRPMSLPSKISPSPFQATTYFSL
jgi:hypothetical protein